MEQRGQVTRRGFFRTVGVAGAAAMTVGSVLTVAPRNAEAAVEALIAEKMGDGPITMEKVQVDTPATAENATLVRIPVTVDHPMEADNYIQSVAIFVDNNPSPFIALFEFTPDSGKVDFEFRTKMAKTSKLRAVAKTNTGKLFGFVKEIKVAAGGCA